MKNIDCIGVKNIQILDGEGKPIDAIRIDNPFCEAEIAYQGAQILKFYDKQKAKNILWCTNPEYFKQGKAIRGGIPLCFPWFGAHKSNSNLPAHGFARTMPWNLASVQQLDDNSHQLSFQLNSNQDSFKYWNYAFLAELKMTFGKTLNIEFSVMNEDVQPFEFSFAWHSYFAVSDIGQIQIDGLQDTDFIDKLNPESGLNQQNGLIRVQEEIDRVYQQASGNYKIIDNDLEVSIHSPQCKSAVIWNPWQDKALRLGDVKDQDWHHFVCVESGQITPHEETLSPQSRLSYQLTIQML